ncbi:MAG: PIN domain-containing protein [Rhizonema sp. PD37]|nr:PIN domain-containing protein [Rhizonema sp. PD37]
MILYVETNFVMSIATGRDSQANTLLSNTPESVHIVMPSICFMEALSALEVDIKSRRRFHNELEIRSGDAQRNLTSQHAQSLLSQLQQAQTENDLLLREVQASLFAALDQLATKAERIELTTEMIQASLEISNIDEPTDRLILHCILNHARLHLTEVKVFLSGNSKDFGKLEVQQALQDVGINQYFSNTQTFLNWLRYKS